MRDKYNVVVLLSDNIEKYTELFDLRDAHRCESCVTAWDTFSYEIPGECKKITVNVKTVYDLPDELKSIGMYFAERREAY